MRVLVTGAGTTLGCALVHALAADPAVQHVVALGGGAAPPGVTVVEADLARPREVRDLIHGVARRLEVDSVVHAPPHLAARDVGRRVHADNVEATRELLLTCEATPKLERFVYWSAAAVYAIRTAEPNLLDEDAALELDPRAPQWVRDRVQADLVVCARIGVSRLAIDVLRGAEILAPGTGSQLWDYLQTRVCLRPLGFDPMVNVLSLDDAVDAIRLALRAGRRGIHNVPGNDTLPLSALIAAERRLEVVVPGPLLAPLYHLRAWTTGLDFRYDVNARRFHLGGVLDGGRARDELDYRPRRSAVGSARNAFRPRR